MGDEYPPQSCDDDVHINEDICGKNSDMYVCTVTQCLWFHLHLASVQKYTKLATACVHVNYNCPIQLHVIVK